MSNKQTEVEDAAKSVWGRVYMFQSCDDKRAILRIEQAITKAKEEEKEKCMQGNFSEIEYLDAVCFALIKRCRETNATSMVVNQDGVTFAEKSIGDWKITVEALSPKEDHLPDDDLVSNQNQMPTNIQKPTGAKWDMGDRLMKKPGGGEWHGIVCGFYSTDITPIGYCIQSEREKLSVQLYPEKALEKMI